MTKMNIPLKGQNRICYSTNFHLRTWLLYSLLVADSVQGTNDRISEEGKQGVRQIARITIRRMKRLGGFVFDAKNKCGNKNETQQYQINFTINLEVWEILRNFANRTR